MPSWSHMSIQSLYLQQNYSKIDRLTIIFIKLASYHYYNEYPTLLIYLIMINPKIQYSYLEVISFYQNLLKYVKQLEAVINDKQKTKFKLFTEIEGILSKFPQLHKRTAALSSENMNLKKKLYSYEQVINNYKSREQLYIKKINKLQTMNNKFLQAFSRLNQKDFPVQKFIKKSEDSQIIIKKIQNDKFKIQDKISIFKYDEYNIANLFASTRSVYNFFLRKLDPIEQQRQIHIKKQEFQQLLTMIDACEQQVFIYQKSKLSQDMKKLINQIESLKISYQQYKIEKQKLHKQQFKQIFIYQQVNTFFQNLQKLFDKKSKLTKQNLAVLQNQKYKLRKIQAMGIQNLKNLANQLLQEYQIIPLIENHVKFQNQIQQNFITYKNAFKEVQINSANHSQIYKQSNVQLLKNTIKHEKSLIKSLTEFFMDTDIKMTNSKNSFTQHLKMLEQEIKSREMVMREKDQKILQLQKNLQQRKNNGETSFLEQESVNISMTNSRRYNQYKLKQLEQSRRQQSKKLKKKLSGRGKLKDQSIMIAEQGYVELNIKKPKQVNLKLFSKLINQIIYTTTQVQQIIQYQQTFSNPSSFSFRQKPDQIIQKSKSVPSSNSPQFFAISQNQNQSNLIETEEQRYNKHTYLQKQSISPASDYRIAVDQIVNKINDIKTNEIVIKQIISKINRMNLSSFVSMIEYNEKKYDDINQLIQNELIKQLNEMLVPKFGAIQIPLNNFKKKSTVSIIVDQNKITVKKMQQQIEKINIKYKLQIQNLMIQISKSKKQNENYLKINKELKQEIQDLKNSIQQKTKQKQQLIMENQKKDKQFVQRMRQIQLDKKKLEFDCQKYTQDIQNFKQQIQILKNKLSQISEIQNKNNIDNDESRKNKSNNNRSIQSEQHKKSMSKTQEQNILQKKQSRQGKNYDIVKNESIKQEQNGIYEGDIKFQRSVLQQEFDKKMQQIKREMREQKQEYEKVIEQLKQKNRKYIQRINELDKDDQDEDGDSQNNGKSLESNILGQLKEENLNEQNLVKIQQLQKQIEQKNRQIQQLNNRQNQYKNHLNNVRTNYQKQLIQHKNAQTKMLQQNKIVQNLKKKSIFQQSQHKHLLAQFKILEQANKTRIIKQQNYINFLLQNTQYKPEVNQHNKPFLSQLYIMHKKILDQNIQIKQLLQEKQVQKIKQDQQIQKLRLFVLKQTKK